MDRLNKDKRLLTLDDYLEIILPNLNKVLCKILGSDAFIIKNSYNEQNLIVKNLLNILLYIMNILLVKMEKKR